MTLFDLFNQRPFWSTVWLMVILGTASVTTLIAIDIWPKRKS